MWLLDVNLPTALTRLLQSYPIVAETAAARGWRDLTNGALAQAACREGFRVVLTRDRRFGTSAGNILETLPKLAVVIVTFDRSARPPISLPSTRRGGRNLSTRSPVQSSNGHEVPTTPLPPAYRTGQLDAGYWHWWAVRQQDAG